MTADTGQPRLIGPDHQLPAHIPEWPRSRRIAIAVVLLIAAALAVAFLVLRPRKSTTRTATSPPMGIAVTTATARKGDIAVHLEAIGTVTPVHTASITSQVTGLVTTVHYQEGQRVEKGDPLVDIDSRPYRATLLQAQGALERDENLLAEAQMDLARYRDAWARNAIAKQTLDDQEKVVLQDTGTVKNDQGTVQYDEVQVEFCRITAPIGGRVGLRLVDPGNVVQSTGNAVLAVVTQIEPITVVFTIPEDSLSSIRQKSELAVDAFDRTAQKKLASGKLLALDNQIDTTTGTVKARALFDNADDALFPNQFVNARVLVETRHGVTLVPASAVQQNGAESFVYEIQEGVARIRRVKPGATDGGVMQVDGVAPGDVVADSGFDRLHDGAKVAASSTPAAPPSGSAAPGSAP